MESTSDPSEGSAAEEELQPQLTPGRVPTPRVLRPPRRARRPPPPPLPPLCLLRRWLLLLLAAVVRWGMRRRRMAAFKSAAALLLHLYLLFVSILSAPRRRPRLRMFQRHLPWARASVQATFMVRVQGVQPTTASLMVSVQRLQAATVAVIQAFLKDSVVII